LLLSTFRPSVRFCDSAAWIGMIELRMGMTVPMPRACSEERKEGLLSMETLNWLSK